MFAKVANPTAAFAPGSAELQVQLRRAERSKKIWALVLIAPLFLFLAVTFVVPIARTLFLSVENPELQDMMPDLAAALQAWDGDGMPPDSLVRTFAADVLTAHENRTLARVGKRLNFSISGFRSLLLKTARRMPPQDSPDLLAELTALDKRWGERRYWTALKQAATPYTVEYLLAAVDHQFNPDGEIVEKPPERSIYLTVLARTAWISFVVVTICLFLGYPIAYLLATIPTKYSNLLLLLLLLPFWTSLLVRTTAWLVLLQNQGVVNDLAIWIGLWDEPVQLIRNRLGVYIALVHIMLPFMVLPLFSVMKGISPTHMKAAASLGATPITAFLKVYLPQTLPGAGAGILLVFILTLGFYITPALVGGPSDQMLSQFIAFNASTAVNWGMAGALSLLLMVGVAIFFSIYSRLVGVRDLRLG